MVEGSQMRGDGALAIKLSTITLNTRLTDYLSQKKTNEGVGRDNMHIHIITRWLWHKGGTNQISMIMLMSTLASTLAIIWKFT